MDASSRSALRHWSFIDKSTQEIRSRQIVLLVGSTNAEIGFSEGFEILRAGGSALDAVEAVIRVVESNPEDHTVGYSGLPNILGEVELDASIMDGNSFNAGAVCAVKNYEHPISIARKVMERLPHVMLAGAGAERFAKSTGFTTRELLTAEARTIYESRIGDYSRYTALRDSVLAATTDPEIAAAARIFHGTVDVIALDRKGNIASGVSTSGWGWKYPGRVGDSPIIGAGNYADNRYGACGCTGYGEMAMRANTAHSVVLYLKMGMSLGRAAREAMRDLRHIIVPFPPTLNLVAIDVHANHIGMTTEPERKVTYVYQTDGMAKPKEKSRIVVRVNKTNKRNR